MMKKRLFNSKKLSVASWRNYGSVKLGLIWMKTDVLSREGITFGVLLLNWIKFEG